MIALGEDFGGPELRGSQIDRLLMIAGQVVMRTRDPNYDDGTEAWINPIFVVPGTVYQPDFSAYEVGHFSKKQKGLVVKIAVPHAVAAGDGITEFICRALREAARLAAEHFASKGINFSEPKAERLIVAVEAELERVRSARP